MTLPKKQQTDSKPKKQLPKALPTPDNTPLDQWSVDWLRVEVAVLIGRPNYLWITDAEKKKLKYPVTEAQMKKFIREEV